MAKPIFNIVTALNELEEGKKIKHINWSEKDHYLVANKISGNIIEVNGDKLSNYKFDNITNISEKLWSKYYDEERREKFDNLFYEFEKIMKDYFKSTSDKDNLLQEFKSKYDKAMSESNYLILINENNSAEIVEDAWMKKLVTECVGEFFARAINNKQEMRWNELDQAKEILFEDWSKICEELKINK